MDVRVSADARCVQFIEIDEEFCKKLDCPSLTMISVKKQIDISTKVGFDLLIRFPTAVTITPRRQFWLKGLVPIHEPLVSSNRMT